MPINVTKIRIKIKGKGKDIVNFKDFTKIINKYRDKLSPGNRYWYIIKDIESIISNYKCNKVFSRLSYEQEEEIKNSAFDNYRNDGYTRPILSYYVDEIMKKVNGEILERV